MAEACEKISYCHVSEDQLQHTEFLLSSILSEAASLAAEARVPMDALSSLATFLLASLEAPEVISLALSPTTAKGLADEDGDGEEDSTYSWLRS